LNTRHQKGFTLIELMVALVVGGLLMASLVALSSSVQRSFGFSTDITQLQGNLRFAMKSLVDDLGRTSLMASANASADYCHQGGCALPTGDTRAFAYEDGVITLRGNYTSTRDYRVDMERMTIVCRNNEPFNTTNSNEAEGNCGGFEEYLEPFADGPQNLDDIFCQGMTVRFGERNFCYFNIQSVNPDTLEIAVDQLIDRSVMQGDYMWLSPVNEVKYRVAQDADYLTRYTSSEPAANRWILSRQYSGCRAGVLQGVDADNEELWTEVGEFLLPADDPNRTDDVPGLELEQYLDSAAGAAICAEPWQPIVDDTPSEITVSPDPVRTKAISITLRGRTEYEDPKFIIPNYGDRGTEPRDPALDFGIDLDGDPTNGLAHVRVERTVVELRNLGLNLNL
jgi:prepilin-type N-terminal cleavage/methylation domain-containing protein